MRKICSVCICVLLFACTKKTIHLPEGTNLGFRMATEGVERFEDYIHSLVIYVFRLDAAGEYVYYKTLAELTAEDIENLEDVSDRGNSKLFHAVLPAGLYKLYFIGNASGHIAGKLEENATLPKDVRILGEANGQENIYFIGSTKVKAVSDYQPAISVTLDRIISKLVLVLYNIPSQIDSVRFSLDHIAADIGIDGSLSDKTVTVRKNYALPVSTDQKDTVVCQFLTLPTSGGKSAFSLTFRADNGQEKTKEMPDLTFLPDRYIRLTGYMNDSPGALISFDFTLQLMIFDYFLDKNLPDFSLNPE